MPRVILLCFHRDEHNDILAVADWGQKLSFYQLSGKQVNVIIQTAVAWHYTFKVSALHFNKANLSSLSLQTL